MPPELHLVAGPNGSGKSTFVNQVRSGARQLDYSIPRVTNPDEIAPTLPEQSRRRGCAGSARSTATACASRAARENFSIETTLQGKSEVRLIGTARAASYRITMTYLALVSPEANVNRVKLRESEERRTVPAADVRRRYERSLDALAGVVGRLDRADVFDSTGRDFPFLATLQHGRVIRLAQQMPALAERALAEQLASSSMRFPRR